MNTELQKLKEKLDTLLNEESPTSGNVLELSRKIDLLIAEYYRGKCSQSATEYDIEQGCA